jgi:hypothetical protein
MSPQAGWILEQEIVPRLSISVPNSVLCVGAEDPQELIQDATVIAARMLDRVERQGKLGKVSASNISYYTVKHLQTGRRANGSQTVDVFGSATQLNGSTRLHSLHEVVAQSDSGDEIFELQDVISQDSEDPSVQAARRLDWETFCHTLSKLELVLVECLVKGLNIREAARIARVSYWTMRNYMKRVADKIIAWMGADILAQVQRRPQWKQNLDATRERMADG